MSDVVDRLKMALGDTAAFGLVAVITASDCKTAVDELTRLREENARLREDAERYQWLRKHHVRGPYITDLDGCAISGDDADEDVDAARAGGGESGDAGR